MSIRLARAMTVVLLAGGAYAQTSPAPSARILVGPNERASSNPPTGSRNEGWVAASTSDSLFLVAASHTGLTGGCATMVSHDGGSSWTEAHLPGAADLACFDP